MGLNAIPQVDARKHDAAYQCGAIIMNAVRTNLRPRDIVTRAAIDNAIASVAASGGSTNAVLHLLAFAREAGVPLTIDDFEELSNKTPLLADLKPAGRYTAADVDKAGGIPVIAKRLHDGGYVDSSALTITGKSFGVTNLIALDANGTLLAESLVRVGAASDAVLTVQRGMERESYSCTPNCMPVVELGDGPVFGQASGQITSRNSLAAPSSGSQPNK